MRDNNQLTIQTYLQKPVILNEIQEYPIIIYRLANLAKSSKIEGVQTSNNS